MVVHDSYQAVLEQLAYLFEGIKPNFNEFHHSTSLTAFEKRLHRGAEPIHFGIAVDFDDVESVIQFVSYILGDEFLKVDGLEDFVYAKELETVRQALVDVRVGQGSFRRKLVEMWGGCSVTNVSQSDFLIASHIRPWVKSNNVEKLDVYNGLLLTPNLDKAFDKGFITFDSTGNILISREILDDANLLGINTHMSLRFINKAHQVYLEWHRENLFKNA
ncbi:HNH endonuclease [Photobacterium kasasachensis]|uniref:HNH endonuclease n=1 Tax=Photobacterium kasasachensis TaxID=2910240 RepID=UPI003D13835D